MSGEARGNVTGLILFLCRYGSFSSCLTGQIVLYESHRNGERGKRCLAAPRAGKGCTGKRNPKGKGKRNMERADAMLKAADGYADDEMVWFEGERYSAWRLRDMADDILDNT